MKKILFGVMTLVLVLGLVGGGAFAYFNDTETSTGNTFTAGSLDLTYDVAGGDEYNGTEVALFTIDDVKPGDSDVVVVSMHNNGSIDGAHLTIKFDNLVDNENSITEPEAALSDTAATGELSGSILVTIWEDDGDGIMNGTEFAFATDVVLGSAIGDDLPMGSLGAHSVTYLAVEWTIDPDATNIIQTDSTVCDAEFTLTQD